MAGGLRECARPVRLVEPNQSPYRYRSVFCRLKMERTRPGNKACFRMSKGSELRTEISDGLWLKRF